MPKVRIYAAEHVHYRKTIDELSDSTISQWKEDILARQGEASDFNLDPCDIETGELEYDDMELDIWNESTGKWVSAFP
jgi:hypothetical protein